MDKAIAYHSEIASKWESGYSHEVFSVRKTLLLEMLADIDLVASKWVDAGCGTGTLARFLAERKGCQVLGVDASDEMIRHCVTVPNTEFRRIDDLCRSGLPDEAFDGVLCSSVIEYIANPRLALRELHRLLKPNGTLLVSVPNAHPIARWPVVVLYWLTKKMGHRRMFQYLDHSRHCYFEGSFRRLLESCGFAVELTRTYGGLRGSPLLGQGTLIMVRARKI